MGTFLNPERKSLRIQKYPDTCVRGLNVAPNSNPLGIKRFIPGISISFQAPSTSIRIFFWIRNVFTRSVFKLVVHTESIQIEFARPHVSETYPDSL